MRENNDQLFQIELDTQQKSPRQFSDLVNNNVKIYYDESIHKKNLKETTPKKIDAYVKKKVRFI